jgi:hypothetical protein
MNSGNVFVANTVNMSVSDPIIELGLNNIGTNDLGIIMSRPAANSNVAVVFDESDDILRMGYTLNGASDSIVDLDSNALAVSVQGALSAGSNLEVGTANLFVDTSTSRVGIGMSNPSYTLDVDGDINLSTGSTLKINGTDAVFSNWTANGSDIYRSSGNVGIGTTNPDYKLHIRSGTATALLLESDNGGTGYPVNIDFRNYDAQDPPGARISVIDDADYGSDITFNTKTGSPGTGPLSQRMIIQGDGNVGIGTTSPQDKLHVSNGHIRIDLDKALTMTSTDTFTYDGGTMPHYGLLWRGHTAYTGSRTMQIAGHGGVRMFTAGAERLTILNNGNVGIGTTSPGSLLTIESTTGNQMRLNYNADWYNIIERDSSGDLNFLEKAGASASLKNLMTIKTGGNVGIGTTDPIAKLDIDGGAENNTTPALSIRGGSYDPSDLYVLNTYNVNTGVGYAAKVIGVNIKNKVETDNTVQIRNNVGGVTSAGAIYLGSDDVNQGIFGVLGGTGTAGSTLAEYLTVKGNGNVGIGTNDPSGDLHVHGENIYLSSKLVSNCTWRIMPQTGNSTKKFRIYDNDNSADRFVIDADGHVIIGDTGVTYDPAAMSTSLTATPSAPILHVNGTIQLKNDSDAIVIGNNNATFLKDEELHFGWGGGWYMNDATNLRVVNNKKIYSTGQAGFGGNVGIGTTSPAVRLHVEGGTSFDASCTTRLRCAASAYGRNQLQLIGRYEGLNDAWSATGARNAIMFKYQTSSSSAYTDAWTIQSFPNGSNNDLGFMSGTNNTPKVVFRGNGNVGIGTTNPQYGKLHINGNGGGAWTNYYYFNGGGGLSHSTNWALANTSLYVTGGIVAGDYVAASDERIKKDIVDADDSECLEALRLLKPKRYRYKDELDRGEGTVWGFIAQEVRETLPHSTKLLKSVVPNIYEMGNVSSSNVITFTNFNTADLESNATTFIRTMGADGAEHGIHLEEVIDEHTIRVKEDLTDWIGSVDETGNIIAGTQLFVYGQEVDNFVFLKKDAVWTTATAALQEVDRQLQAEKTKTATLETQVASLLERVTALENA